jgi:hypothetical protein
MGGMWLAVFLAMTVFAGSRVTRLLSRDPALDGRPFERASTTALVALSIGLAISWALALPKMLTRETLLGGGLVVAAVAAWLGRRPRERRSVTDDARSLLDRVRRGLRRELDAKVGIGIAVVLAWFALGGWCAFALWRGATVFSPNHDGVAYHLPKAAMIALAHGYQTFDGPDVRVSFWPCDYELLLADAILLDGSDLHTAWVSTASLVAFLLAVGALAERWWARGPQVILAVLLAGGMTVVLLMSDAHKNDLMTAALFLTAVSNSARWAARGERTAAFTAVLALAITIGTKGSAFFLVASLLPLAAWGLTYHWRLGRRPRLGSLAIGGAAAAALFVLVGGAVFVRNALDTGHPMPADPENAPIYDGFSNLWHFPYLAFTRPFSLSPDEIWVPWAHAYRGWGRHDLFFSEWGLPSSLLLFAVPFGVARYGRREVPGEATPAERALASLSLVVLFFLFLPLRMERISVLAASGECRFTLFLPVLVALWTAVPAVAELHDRGGRGHLAAAATVFGAVALFAGYARYEAEKDLYEPLDYVMDIASRPEDRHTRRSGQNFRAGVIVDRVAGPTDEVAFDGGFDGWSYYCFGKTLGRRVTFLHPERGLPVEIPDSAKWVVVDRIVNIDFGHPRFVAGDWSFLGLGKATAQDLAVYDQLRKDPHFKLVYSFEEKNQAVFARVPRS